ncbi:MAG TPA: hypothetical protein VKU86_01155 [Acidimicrobiales bacterium]|nr:hypothetical protein [Acidimicrobiales bacterium]
MAGISVPTRAGAHSQRQPVASRLAALARAVEGARRRPQIDVRKAMLVGGATAIGLGFVAIILGWYGAAHSAYLFQEVPYLISGGLLGVALVAGGGFIFFAAWLVRMMEENRKYAARVEQTLERVDRALIAVATDAAAAAAASFPAHHTNGFDAPGQPAAHGAVSNPGPGQTGSAGPATASGPAAPQ